MNTQAAVNDPELRVFVPHEGEVAETAVLLTGTATEFDIPQSHIRSDLSRGGFWISDQLADIVYDEADTETPDSPETGQQNVTEKG